MDADLLRIVIIVLFGLSIILIPIIIIGNQKSKKIKTHISKLEYQKNQIDCAPIAPELNKVEGFLKNEKIEVLYQDWTIRLEKLKKEEIPKLTDMILETDYASTKMDYKTALHKIAKLEIELYKTRTYSEKLLSEIMEITTSEERNRVVITKLKEKYRNLFKKFTDEKGEYQEVGQYVKLQFENISFSFEQFEKMMDNNDYTELSKTIKSISEMIEHMEVVVEEVPLIVMTATNVLSKKIDSVQKTYDEMIEGGYPLDYLNVEYNIAEANKKITDVMERLKVLNLEDSLFELNVLMDYFDSLFNDFEKEKSNRSNYDEIKTRFERDLVRLKKLLEEIFKQVDELKTVYELSVSDVDTLKEQKNEIMKLESDYQLLIDHTRNNTFAYSKLVSEINGLSNRLKEIDQMIEETLKSIGNMKEDEIRARQQLEEVKMIFKESRIKLRDYILPIIPKPYFVELNEASAAIKEVIKELKKVPITIATLNTRVDTSRDLVLKFFNTNKEIVKTAMFAEMAIVYGNRYRSKDRDLEKQLTYAEVLFFRGEYQKSLELTINSLNKIEMGIYDKLLRLHEEKSKKESLVWDFLF